ncbi:putative flavin-containing monoamine oxidase AofH [Drosophila albomicans]|uniref:Amine oxidase n=1 Tax=Drosophila albomicans TaxID=7291 RepID=A0A6P8XJC6_DROAB|nr:putative flavin-containing monoamine oxidase AofH [Drosophila albomicans]
MDLPFGHASPDLDVLIVGAGLSGLTSAVKILAKENSLNMKILDECSTPGGQLGTQGVRFVNSEQTELLTFLNQMNVPLQERIENERMQLKRCRDLDRGVLAMPIKFELTRYINMLDMRMKKFSSLRFPLQKRSMTMERHICSNLFFQRSRQIMFNLVELCSGLAANQIKYDEFMCLCSCCGGLGVMIDLYIDMPNSLMEVSCKQLLDSMLEKVKSIDILQNTCVAKVKHFKDYAEVISVNGTKYTAQVVILALPWDRVMQLDFEPPLPKLYQKISTSKPEPKTLLTQFHIRYSRSFWIYHGYSGDFSKIEPFIVGFAHPPAAYSGYILHTEGELISVRDTVLELLAEPFGEEMLSPLEFNQQTMLLSTAMIKPQTKPWLRIIWSGSASVATRNRNLMGGAVESGIRAAVNALYVVRPQVVSWRDLSDVQDKKLYEGVSFSRTSSLLSRINLYNFTFYSVFVIGLIVLLNFGYRQSAEIQV